MTYKPEKQIGGRLGKSDLEWAANKLLKGAGAGADPAEIDVPEAVRDVIVSETLKHSNDPSRPTSSDTYVKLKEMLLNADMSPMRLKFTLSASVDHTVMGQIYKNGVAIGTEHTVTGTTTTFSEDFTGWVAGDLIQIYAKRTAGATYTVTNSDMRLYYDIRLTAIFGDTLASPLLTTTTLTPPTNQDPA